jgi:hypothetical protein
MGQREIAELMSLGKLGKIMSFLTHTASSLRKWTFNIIRIGET